MDNHIFESIKTGMEDALAFIKGDKNHGRALHVIGHPEREGCAQENAAVSPSADRTRHRAIKG